MPNKEEGKKAQEHTVQERVRFTNKVVKDGLRNVASHHIESFNYAFEKNLPRICKNMLAVELAQQNTAGAGGKEPTQFPFKKYTMWFENFELQKPQKPHAVDASEIRGTPESSILLPYECRLRSMTYSAPLIATVCRKIDDEAPERVTLNLGDIPIMVLSNNCHLNGLNEEDLARAKEDMHEFGGYFIVNGNERLIRMLIMNKRNYPVCFERGSFCNRGRLFTQYAVQMRCVREDMFAQTLTLHYLTDGNCVIKFIYHKQEFLVPVYVLLKALMPSTNSDGATDKMIFDKLVGTSQGRQDQIEGLLSDGQKLCLYSQEQCLGYVGSRLRTVLEGITQEMSDVEVGRFLLERILLVHCSQFKDKFNCLCLMIDKLYSYVAGECSADNLDAVANQEVMLGGHLYG